MPGRCAETDCFGSPARFRSTQLCPTSAPKRASFIIAIGGQTPAREIADVIVIRLKVPFAARAGVTEESGENRRGRPAVLLAVWRMLRSSKGLHHEAFCGELR
jgi:hypothetical protein